MRPIAATLASIVDTAWVRTISSSTCRDCVQTTVVLKWRDGDVVRMYVASWDESQKVGAELRELRRLAFELRGR